MASGYQLSQGLLLPVHRSMPRLAMANRNANADALSPVNVRESVEYDIGRAQFLRGLRADQAVDWAERFVAEEGPSGKKMIVYCGNALGRSVACIGKCDGVDDSGEYFTTGVQKRLSVTQNAGCVETMLLHGDAEAAVLFVPTYLSEILQVAREIRRFKRTRRAPLNLFFLVDSRFAQQVGGFVELVEAFSGERMRWVVR